KLTDFSKWTANKSSIPTKPPSVSRTMAPRIPSIGQIPAASRKGPILFCSMPITPLWGKVALCRNNLRLLDNRTLRVDQWNAQIECRPLSNKSFVADTSTHSFYRLLYERQT